MIGDQFAIERHAPEQGQGALVGQLHAQFGVQHQNARAHALQDQRVQGPQAGDITGALFGQVLAGAQQSAQPLNHKPHSEAQHTQGTRLQVVVGGGRSGDAQVERQVDDADGGECGDQQAEATAQQQVAHGHGGDHQVADAAGRAATGVEQAGEHDHVGGGQAEYRQHPARVAHQHHDQDVENEVEPAAGAEQFAIGDFQQAVVHVAGNQQDQGQTNGQAVEVVQAQHPLRLGAAEKLRFSGHRCRALAPDEAGCNTSGCHDATRCPLAGARRTGRSEPWSARPACALREARGRES